MKIFTGKVVHKKIANTARVAVTRVVAHPVYKKRFKRVKHYLIHDELGSQVGDKVRFVASKPYSKLKKWKLIEIVKDDKKPATSKRKVSKTKK